MAFSPALLRNPYVTGEAAGLAFGNAVLYAHRGIYNVMEAGAKGDGVTDDRAAIQSAIDAAVGGGIVYFPKPSAYYKLEATSNFSGLATHLRVYGSNISLIGQGSSTIRSDVAAAMVRFGPSNNFALQGLIAYDIEPAARYEHTITLATEADATNFAVNDFVYIRTGQTLSSGINQPDAEINQIVVIDGAELTMRWPLCKAYAQEYFISGAAGLTSVAETGNPAILGVANATSTVSRNVEIAGINWVSTGGNSVFNNGCMVGYKFHHNSGSCAGIFQSIGSFRDGVIEHNSVTITDTNPSALWAFSADTGCSNISISWNDVVSRSVAMLHVHEGSSQVRIQGNSLHSTQKDADTNSISIRGRGYDISILDNLIINSGRAYGIYVDDTCTGGGIIAGNTVQGGFKLSGIRYPDISAWVYGANRSTVLAA